MNRGSQGRVLPAALAWIPVWQRNLLVWRKMAAASLLGQFGEPFLYLIALGYGLGGLVGQIEGMPYVLFLASGIVCSSAMFTASFEGMYSAFTRMTVQGTWPAMLATPLTIRDIVIGEAVWAATKGVFSATCILVVAAIMGIVEHWSALAAIPIAFAVALCFASIALVVTALASSYDTFLFYTTLGVTPMMMLGGVFFPLQRMPELVQTGAQLLPLTHGVALARPLVTGDTPASLLMAAGGGIGIIAAYTVASLYLAVALSKRRLGR
ncbi:MAG: nodulation protein NodJ [Gammaproteobacteria bacterium]|nr:nodulation protein NodJ [Gammaproteobacteria bacterium]